MSSDPPPLGRLERVDARSVWAGEASHFTPWLAEPENLELLGKTIGIDLELEAQEKDVGPFRADILCRDTATDDWVLVENQLARTDHGHLGQLLTYAAGLKAVTIVWIADRFTDEHRAALDWLNEITDEEFNFFGLELEVWRIGNSVAAPKFNVASKPNDWSRSVSHGARRELTDSRQLQLAFWTQFGDFVRSNETSLRYRKPQPRHWMTFAVGRTGFRLIAVASLWDSVAESYDQNELRVELYMGGDQAKDHFAALQAQQPEIEAELGYPLEWYSRPENKASKIFARRAANLEDKNSWPELHRWLLEHLNEFDQVFRNRIREL